MDSLPLQTLQGQQTQNQTQTQNQNQNQNQHQRQHQGQPNNHVDLAATSYNYPPNAPNDAFHNYFNNNPASSFNAPWGSEAIDPRIQRNAFAQTSPAWHHTALNAQGSLQTPHYGLPASGYDNAFARPQDAYSYAGYHNQQPLSFANNDYDPALTYGTGALLDDAAFVDHGSHSYGNSDVQEQTISPSALQSFAYPPFPAASDDPIPPARSNDAQLAPRKADEPAVPPQMQYDDRQAELVSASIPSGVITNELSVRDPAALTDATKSTNFTGFVFIGGNTVDSDDSRVILPKTVHRRSVKDLKRQVRIAQGNEPWTKEQQPLAKKLRLSKNDNLVPAASRSLVNGSGVPNKPESSSDSASESGSDEESDYESDSDEQPETDIPDILQSARPTDSMKAIEYDVVETVWRQPNQRVGPEDIRSALGRYEKLIKELRDKWKQEENAVTQAEEKKDQALVDKCKARAAARLKVLENACRLTEQYGHQDIVGRLGEIPLLCLAFAQLLVDRIKISDENGTCVTSVLLLMARFDTINQKGWEGARVEKTLLRLMKRSNEKTKVLAQRVLDEAEQYLKDKSADSKSAQTVEVSKAGALNMPNRPAQSSEPVSTLKRPREPTTPAVVVPKKSNSIASSRQGSANAPKTAGTLGKATLSTKPDGKTSSTSTAVSTTAPKVKVNHVVAKPSVFASLQSASKKPGTSLAALKAAQQSDAKGSKPSEGRAAAAAGASAPKPTFSFAETMANLTKPKEVPLTTKAEENMPPETEEEKKKRLRKEERRKLRVSFKPDDSLTEVRTFVHDPEEEMGHDDSMIRDVGDVGGEGRMLKMHKDLEGLDEDEEGMNTEELLAPWNPPSLVDFSVVEAEELARNCVTRGGKVEVRSKERAVQEQRELTVLMAFYTSLADVPSSPREPADPYSGEVSTELMFGAPSDETKRREAQYYMSQSRYVRPTSAPPVAAAQAPDISALLQILNSQQPAAAPQQYQAPQSQSTGLEAIFAQFSGKQPAAPQPAVPQQLGLLDPGIQAALAAVNGQNYGQQTYAPPAPPVPSQTPDLQALLSQLGQLSNSPQQSYNYQSAFPSDGSRKRQYNHDDQRHEDQYSAGKTVRGNNGKKFFGVPTVPCRFWQEGKCKKGDECTFLHE
ncbi:hypothetical protein MMC26_002031 [Xylographa opegraphella]|nr:hypothetical protein [Xylographa opegraphella]